MASSSSDPVRTLRCPDALWQRLERVAAAEDRSVSAALRVAITRYVVRAEGEQGVYQSVTPRPKEEA
jgi:predicted transcriptional regulator